MALTLPAPPAGSVYLETFTATALRDFLAQTRRFVGAFTQAEVEGTNLVVLFVKASHVNSATAALRAWADSFEPVIIEEE
jgi:hypothetical protein